MRCVAGTDLRQLLRQHGRLTRRSGRSSCSAKAGRALDAARRRGPVHRDVKPANRLVERDSDGADPEHVYLADFGITKHLAGRSGPATSGAFRPCPAGAGSWGTLRNPADARAWKIVAPH